MCRTSRLKSILSAVAGRGAGSSATIGVGSSRRKARSVETRATEVAVRIGAGPRGARREDQQVVYHAAKNEVEQQFDSDAAAPAPRGRRRRPRSTDRRFPGG